MEIPNLNPVQPIPFWNELSEDDKNEYQNLRENFQQQHLVHSKGRSNSFSFQTDLRNVLAFIERSPDNQEIRSIVCGVCFGNSFVCVNTRQLKFLIGKCKSSINNGFQHLGYVSSKNKVKTCLITALPKLLNDPTLMRQWTVRCADANALPIRKLLMTSQQRPLLPTPQINFYTHREALPMPLFTSSPKDDSDAPVFPNLIPRPLSTPILPPNIPTFTLYDEDNIYDPSFFQKDDIPFSDTRESITFDDNNNNNNNNNSDWSVRFSLTGAD